MKKKRDLDLEVAILLNLKQEDVARTTAAFLEQVMRFVAQEGTVYLQGFGRFRFTIARGVRKHIELTTGTLKKGQRGANILIEVPKKYRVHFKKAPRFRTLLLQKHGDETRRIK